MEHRASQGSEGEPQDAPSWHYAMLHRCHRRPLLVANSPEDFLVTPMEHSLAFVFGIWCRLDRVPHVGQSVQASLEVVQALLELDDHLRPLLEAVHQLMGLSEFNGVLVDQLFVQSYAF